MILNICIVSVLLAFSCTSAFLKRRPIITVTQHSPCPDFENELIIAGGNVTKYNKTMQLVSGFAKFTVPIDKTYKGGGVVYRFRDNKWQREFGLEKDDPCVALRLLLGPIYAKLLDVTHAGRRCPVPAVGTYSVTNFPIDASSVPMSLPTGHFKGQGYLISKKDNKKKFCYEGEAIITLE